MGFLDRLLGRTQGRETEASRPPGPDQRRTSDPDAAALERYRYLLRTAPPDRIEEAHAEAFAQLTPEQRRQVLEQLVQSVPPEERPRDDSPAALARAATRAEMRQPGTLERSLGSRGPGMGGILAGSLVASVAGAFVGTAIAQQMFSEDQAAEEVPGDEAGTEPAADDVAAGSDEPRYGEDFGDSGGGGDFGDFGDLGGGF
jgi:hypothetical protein